MRASEPAGCLSCFKKQEESVPRGSKHLLTAMGIGVQAWKNTIVVSSSRTDTLTTGMEQLCTDLETLHVEHPKSR